MPLALPSKVLLLLVFPAMLAAQDSIPVESTRWWLSIGGAIGWVRPSEWNGLGGVVGAQVETPLGLLGMRVAGMGEIDWGTDSDGRTTATDVSLLYGGILRAGPAELGMAGGVGLVYARQGDNTLLRTTVGIPYQIGITFPTTSAAIGFTLYGNLNGVASFHGVAMVVNVGRLR